MSREKQIEEMAKIAQDAIDYYSSGDCPYSPCRYRDSSICCDVCCAIETLYNAGYRKQEWISVDERLPEDMLPDDYKYKTIKVLVAIRAKNGVTIRTQQRFLDYIYRDDKRTAFWTWRFSGGDVTHWMPLPEAPMMEGNGTK